MQTPFPAPWHELSLSWETRMASGLREALGFFLRRGPQPPMRELEAMASLELI